MTNTETTTMYNTKNSSFEPSYKYINLDEVFNNVLNDLLTTKTATESKCNCKCSKSSENMSVENKKDLSYMKYFDFPEIEYVQFSLKTTETKPMLDSDGKKILDEKGRVKRETIDIDPLLATVVYFDDGTKTTVINSKADSVEIIETKLSDGSTVKVASEASKERAVVYAIVKRLLGKIGHTDKNGVYHSNEIDGNGFGRILRDIVQNGYDVQLESAKNQLAKDEAKKLRESMPKPTPKKRYSIHETLARINEFLNTMETKVNQ